MLGTKEKRKKGEEKKKESKICDVKSEHFVPSPITTLSLQRPTLSSFTNKHTYTLQVTYLPTTYKPPTRTLFYQHPEPSGEPSFTIPIPPSVLSYFFFLFLPKSSVFCKGKKEGKERKKKKIKKKSKPTKCLLLLPQALQAPQHQPSQPNTKPALPKYAPRRRPTHSYDYNSSAW